MQCVFPAQRKPYFDRWHPLRSPVEIPVATRIPDRSTAGWLKAIGTFRQIKRGGEVVELGYRECDPRHPVVSRVVLFDGDAFLECIDRNVFLKMCAAFVNQGHDGDVELMLDGKHLRLPLVSVWLISLSGKLNG